MELAPRMGGDLAMGGLIALGQGSLLTSMLWSAALALIIQRRFMLAAGWLAAAAGLSAIGIIHAYTLSANGVESRLGGGSRLTSPSPTPPAQPSHSPAPGIAHQASGIS